MSNKQPWYHSADDLLFTATRQVSLNEVRRAIEGIKGVVKGTVEILASDEDFAEPGDPADLVG